MNKIICDICGTAYPETAEQCPICGSAKQTDSNSVSESVPGDSEQSAKTATKGGHFSNSNVRKRNKGRKIPVAPKKAPKPAKGEKAEKPVENKAEQPDNAENNEKSNTGLLAVVWILLIAVVLVLAYIVLQFVLPMYGIDLPAMLNKPDETTSAVDNTT